MFGGFLEFQNNKQTEGNSFEKKNGNGIWENITDLL